MQVDERASGSSVDLGVGQTLEVRLAENPTTGFRWQIEADGRPACTLTSDLYEAASGPPGSGGTRVLAYRGTSPGECTIALAYRRSWEAAASAAQTFMLRVRVVADRP